MSEHQEPTSHHSDPGPPGFWDDANRVNKLCWGLAVVCLLLLVLDLVPAYRAHLHAHPGLEHEIWPGFFPAFGFFAYCGIVAGAVQLRRVLKRPEDYYD